MYAPRFWKTKNLLALLLLPAALIYNVIYRLRCFYAKPYKSSAIVICVGNLTSGGSGKTPFALELGEYLKNRNKRIIFLSKGYKGKCNYMKIVNAQNDKADFVGDEALLLAKKLPTIIAKDRSEGIKLAESLKADIIIMDDGLQNPTIEKNINIVVFDGEQGIKNGLLFPAGPMRESLKMGLSKATLKVFIGEDKTNLKAKLGNDYHEAKFINFTKPHKKKKYFAFAAIGNPDKFFTLLKNEGFSVIKTKIFADHYNYKNKDIKKLISIADKHKLQLITTEKDAIKISKELLKNIIVLKIRLDFNFFNIIDNLIYKETQ